MALTAGRLTLVLEYGKGLKDKDWFGRMDPYAVIRCGNQRVRSQTHVDGGRNPVWAQRFEFNIINDNNIEVELWDSDEFSRDDHIGTCSISLAKARTSGSDRVEAPVISKRTRRQHGFIVVSLTFVANQAPTAYNPAPVPYQAPAPAPTYYQQQPSCQQPPAYQQPPQPPQYYQQPAGPQCYNHPTQSYPPQPQMVQHVYQPPQPPQANHCAPSAPPANSYYPNLPTNQQFYPGQNVPSHGCPPEPIKFFG